MGLFKNIPCTFHSTNYFYQDTTVLSFINWPYSAHTPTSTSGRFTTIIFFMSCLLIFFHNLLECLLLESFHFNFALNLEQIFYSFTKVLFHISAVNVYIHSFKTYTLLILLSDVRRSF